jgi:UDP-N-acetylglucosamine 4-epimerase
MNVQNQSFLVTGAAGFIGSHIVEYLLNNGAKFVRVLDNLSNGKMSNVEIFQHHANYEFIEGDITDYDTCVKACVGIDKVCHQAAVGSVPRSIKTPLNTNDSNVNGFLNMIFAAKEAGTNFTAKYSTIYTAWRSLVCAISMCLVRVKILLDNTPP